MLLWQYCCSLPEAGKLMLFSYFSFLETNYEYLLNCLWLHVLYIRCQGKCSKQPSATENYRSTIMVWPSIGKRLPASLLSIMKMFQRLLYILNFMVNWLLFKIICLASFLNCGEVWNSFRMLRETVGRHGDQLNTSLQSFFLDRAIRSHIGWKRG